MQLQKESDDMRLIDADAFSEQYGDYYAEQGTEEGFIGTVGDQIAKQPTIEPEVRHGRWKKKNGEIYFTNCKKSKWSESFELMLRGFDFCQKCGARMDGGAENV